MASYPGDHVGQIIGELLFADYAEAQVQPNPGMGVWFWRTAWDTPLIGLEVSISKHRAEWRAALGLSQPQLPPPASPLTKWRGVSGFGLLVAPEAVQDNFFGFWQGNANVVRVFTTCTNLFDLRPEDGRERLPTLCQKAAKYGFWIEAVALVDTNPATNPPGRQFDYAHHLEILRGLDVPNLLVEGANEPLQPWQGNVRELIKQAGGRPVLYAVGAADNGNDETTEFNHGDYVTVHCDRKDGDNGWRWVRHVKECWWDLRQAIRKFTVNDEPKRDDLDPAKHFALGCMAWVIGGGDTFHYGGGRWADVPTPEERPAAIGRVTGWAPMSRPPAWNGTFYNAGWQGSPVKSFTGALRCYSSREGNMAYTVALDAANVQIEFGEGFRVVNEWQPFGKTARLYYLERQ